MMFIVFLWTFVLFVACTKSQNTGPAFVAMTDFSPLSGPIEGGTEVNLRGLWFKNGATVTIGGVDCTPVTFLSSKKLSCVTGIGSAGTASLVVSNTDGGTATASSSFTYTGSGGDSTSPTSQAPIVSSWLIVDGNATTGINKDTNQLGQEPAQAVFDSKLYASWFESWAGGAGIRVAVYGGNDSSPIWSFVDGNGVVGINKDTNKQVYAPQLSVFNSKLYATWPEWNGGNKWQTRIAVYNGVDGAAAWTFVDGNGANGLNKNTGNDAQYQQLASFNSKLYATWSETTATKQIRVVVYNGNDSSAAWSFVDGNTASGINKTSAKEASYPQLLSFNSKLYSTWGETNAGDVSQIRMVVYNGNDSSASWSFIDGNGANGINKDTTKDAVTPKLLVFNSKLYALWQETNGKNQVRAAVYNGNDSSPSWSLIDGNGVNGINKDPTMDAMRPQMIVSNQRLYATWYETASKNQIRVAIYNGNDSSASWSFVDGDAALVGINKNYLKDAFYPRLIDFNSKLYACWDENKTVPATYQIRVSVGQ